MPLRVQAACCVVEGDGGNREKLRNNPYNYKNKGGNDMLKTKKAIEFLSTCENEIFGA